MYGECGEREYKIVNKSGQVIGLYHSRNSLYEYTLLCNGEYVKAFQRIGNAYRAYNELAAPEKVTDELIYKIRTS